MARSTSTACSRCRSMGSREYMSWVFYRFTFPTVP